MLLGQEHGLQLKTVLNTGKQITVLKQVMLFSPETMGIESGARGAPAAGISPVQPPSCQ